MSGLGWRLVAVVGGDGQDFMSDLMNFVDQGLDMHGLGVASLALVANLHHGAAVVALHTARNMKILSTVEVASDQAKNILKCLK